MNKFKNQAILSVIIPTHERSRYAIPSIKAILALSNDIEVVVSDTSAKNLLAEHFSNDVRVKIVRHEVSLNVVENFEFGLKNSSGEYLIFLGDDDFLGPEALNVAAWARDNGVDSIRTKFPCHYYWPDFLHKRKGTYYSGRISVSEFTGDISRVDSLKELNLALENLGAGVLGMPRAYAGMISRELAEEIVSNYGGLFGGVSPDIYSAALISLLSKNCVEIDFPFIVPGSSGASTAGLSANGKHIGGLRDNPHIAAFKELVWNPLIPEFYSIQTVWSYSLVEAVKRSGYGQYVPNYPRLYVKCFIFHFAYRAQTFRSIRSYVQLYGYGRLVRGMTKALFNESRWIFGKLFNMARTRVASNDSLDVTGVKDSLDAVEALKRIEFKPPNYMSL